MKFLVHSLMEFGHFYMMYVESRKDFFILTLWFYEVSKENWRNAGMLGVNMK